ncbi:MULTISPECIES: SOS response-associated peptidase [Pseudomonas aeruginosa group]|uniref:Abasic site processing protein n=1 Tax=Pseudomonas aeruginosa TaxID=287 RepID=A0ABD7JUX9_PSEAI|nr:MULTISPECIES: SOS response-associated peptidase family protein [Pseudomonas aeruginosa group]MCR8341403.1 SOS response-associated peptidase [Pseudomonas aeruginosa]MCR8361387.1 SOS response-associated peptidase [Pseudomonas aeruginosa]RTR41464.1 SOS response-associated peptidase [Pseudomonas aeruginosa]RTR93566.1 SOS response-associated peptidase [Pseudomonas paraeruginosa]RTS40667.1 SOS response-associated peptidase [Pseudomonas aeruginosa]
MCSHYEAPETERLIAGHGVAPEGQFKIDLWPCYEGPFIRLLNDESAEQEVPELEAVVGQFGLLPSWAKARSLGRNTYNARTETVATKPTYRMAWRKAKHCIIPAAAIYEPDWRSGKSVPTRISRTDGGIMSIAGLWELWKTPDGELHSYTMLTVNADDHALMQNFHKPGSEKRMVVILPNGLIQDWLRAPVERSMDFMRQYPADRLQAEARA